MYVTLGEIHVFLSMLENSLKPLNYGGFSEKIRRDIYEQIMRRMHEDKTHVKSDKVG